MDLAERAAMKIRGHWDSLMHDFTMDGELTAEGIEQIAAIIRLAESEALAEAKEPD